MINLALFSSGNGSIVENIHKYIDSRKLNTNRKDSMIIKMVFINNKNAYVIKRCIGLRIPYFVFNEDDMKNGKIFNKLKKEKIDFISLCGYLKLIPKQIVDYYKKRIINIHPSLLPKYGGKGMYGMNVHMKVIDNNEKYSGISIHYVNGGYDDGDIIIRIRQRISMSDTPESLANKIHFLEYKWYPVTIYSLCNNLDELY